jgi:NAD(P)-dependent dehydrogenase (short-subunit alcohol dehydrogenase family)
MSKTVLSSSRVAWVTGAGTGIGRELALRLARKGWIVAASARTARDLDSLVGEVPERITAFQLDVTDEAACAATAAQIETALGPVELAVLNAGAYFPTTASNFSVANFRRTVDVNLMGEVNCMGPLAPLMIARHRGHIVLMASLAGYIGWPNAASYGATKAALNSMAQAFKPDFERFGVTISVINPGFVKTPATDKNRFPMPFLMGTGEAVDRILDGITANRFEISFPWQMSLLVRLLASLPNRLKFAVTRRTLSR